ncbi:glycosyltransferase [Microbacterium aurum]
MFESESEDDARPTRRAVVMGTINARIDFTLLDAVVCAGVELLLVGPITDTDAGAAVDRLCERGDVEYRPQAPFRDMPEVLRGCAVGLVPYTHSLFNEGSFPLKTLEYLAAGLPVVATDLPAIRWLGCPDVDVADAPDAFAAAVRTLVDRPGPDLQGRERRRSFAREHDWERRAEAFVEVLALRDEVGARI